MPQSSNSESLLKLINSKLASQLVEARLDVGDAVIRVQRERVLDLFGILKLDSELSFNLLVDITAVDWMDQREERFEVVYHLTSLLHRHRLRIKVWVPESNPEVESLCALWSGANFLEREVWDMYGITFKGHPDLRRILMYDEFKGHPLRKDYPVQAKQPRVKLRYPEVQNTATLMHRSELVQIASKKKTAAQSKEARGTA